MRTPDPPDGPGEEQSVDRLWGLPDEGNVLGGVWDGVSGQRLDEEEGEDDTDSWISGEFANNENWDVMSNNEVEINEGFPPPFGRGAHHQWSRIYRPGEGRTRPNTPEHRSRGGEEPNASTWLLRTTSPRQGAFRRRRTGSSSTVGESQSEVSGSFDGEGHFTVRFRQRDVDAPGRRRRSAEAQTEPAAGAFQNEPVSVASQEGGTEEVPQVIDEAELLASGSQDFGNVIQTAETEETRVMSPM